MKALHKHVIQGPALAATAGCASFATTLFQGQTLASHRQIGRHKFYHTGDSIDEFSSDYIVQMKKRVIAEEDPSNTCRNYPNEDFGTYMECDDEFMARTFKDITDGLNLTPPWLTDDLNSATVTPVPWPNISLAHFGRGNIYVYILRSNENFRPDNGIVLRRHCQ